MKIAVVTAIFGGMDTPKPFPPQSVDCDYFCFTEENTPVPLPNLPDRLKAKYFKLQMHRVLPGYDCYVWIDGNIEVFNERFMEKMTNSLAGIRIQKHHERGNIGQEIEFIKSSENIYLTTRYGKQPLWEEYAHYLGQGMPPNAPLYSCNIFSYNKHGAGNIAFIDDWWSLCLEWSYFDQSAFSFLAWQWSKELFYFNGIEAIDLGLMFDNPYFTLHPHDKMQ